jgi:hypothetical protein
LDVLKEFVMLERKTYFEQVPLAIIKEIIEEQTEPEIAIETGRGAKKKTSREAPMKAGSRQRSKNL